MLPIYDKPTLQYIVEEAIALGITDILIVTGRNKRSSRTISTSHMSLNHPSKVGRDCDLKKIRKITDLADIKYVRQKDYNGLRGAIKCGQKHVEDNTLQCF